MDMDIRSAITRLERSGFAVSLQPNHDEPDRTSWIAVSEDGWFATRVRLPVGSARPDVHIGIRTKREPGAFTFWKRSTYATVSRGLALAVAFEFVSVVRRAMF